VDKPPHKPQIALMIRRKAFVSRRHAVPLLILIAGVVLASVFLRDLMSFETLREHRTALLAWRDQSYALAVLGFMALQVVVVVVSLPGSFMMTVAGGFLFGLIPGTLFAVLAASVGALAVFLAARMGLGKATQARMNADGRGRLARRIATGLEENQVSYLLLLRLVPVVPFLIANLAPAFFGVRLRTFLLTTVLGITPGTAVTAWIGVGVGDIFERGGTPDMSLFFSPSVLGPTLGLGVLAALPILFKRLRRR
jgi:uncharacterized membrane protein YdjX (TVP38/TMEM64 family)